MVGELESAVRDLRLEIETLRAVAAEAGDLALRVAGSEGLASGAVDVLAEGRAAKVRSWKRALAIADKERAVLRAELAGLQKRIRHADFHRRAAEDSSRKLLKASREAERLTARPLASPPRRLVSSGWLARLALDRPSYATRGWRSLRRRPRSSPRNGSERRCATRAASSRSSSSSPRRRSASCSSSGAGTSFGCATRGEIPTSP